MEAYLATIKEKTGKTPDDFKVLADQKRLTKRADLMTWLKTDFELGHGHANLITHLIMNADAPEVSADDALDAHFAGAKADWRPAYDALIEQLTSFGEDVSASPGGTYINLLRKGKKFGIIQVTAKRLDIGIKDKSASVEGRFEASGAWNAMVTHRVKIDAPTQIDDEVVTRLHHAYDKA